jgi:hypothetical protein
LTLFCMETALVIPPIGFGAPLASRSASRLRYSAAAFATRFSSSESRRRSNSRRISGDIFSVSSGICPSSLLPSVASDPAIGVNSRRSRASNGLGVRGGGGAFELFSNRLKASPNFPANRFLVLDRDIEGKLDLLACLFPPLIRRSFRRLASWSSIVRRNSTFDSILLSSLSDSPEMSISKEFFGRDGVGLLKNPVLELADSRSRR